MPRRRKSNISRNPWRKKNLLRRLETPEKRAIRLEKARVNNAYRRAHETVLEREERLARCREAARTRRASAKMRERYAQQKIAKLEEKSKAEAAKHTIAMFHEMNFVNCKSLCANGMQIRKVAEGNNERRCRKQTEDFSAGDCAVQNYPLQLFNNQHHLAYKTFIHHTLIQSQLHQKIMNTFPKTPDQMLQFVGVECEVTIEEGEELEEFSEEMLLNNVENLESVVCDPLLVENECSNEQERMTDDEPEIIIGF